MWFAGTVCRDSRMILSFGRSWLKSILRSLFERTTVNLGVDYRDGLRFVAKTALQYRWLVLGVFLGNVFAAAFEGGTMGILALSVSVLVEQQSASDLMTRLGSFGLYLGKLVPQMSSDSLFILLVIVAVVAQAAKSLCTYLARYVSLVLQFRVTRELQERSTNQVMDYSYAQITSEAAGTLAAKIAETTQVSNIILTANRGILSLTMFITYIAIMVLISAPLALVAILIVGVMGFGLSYMVNILKELGARSVRANMATSRFSLEFLYAPRLLRVFGATNFAKKVINGSRAKALDAQERSGKIKAIVEPFIDTLTISTAGIFLISGYMSAGDNAIEVIPKLLIFLLMLNRMMPQARSLNEVRLGLASAQNSVSVAGALLRKHDKQFERVGGTLVSGLDKMIRFEGVSFSYPNTGTQVLRDVTFEIHKGETVALVGTSGSGKSTIASLLLGLYEPNMGRIVIDEMDLRSVELEAWRKRIGTVDQDVFLLNNTVRENIAFASDAYSIVDIETAARRAHAHDFIKAMPNGYDSVIGDRGLVLSGGQQQRLAVARALLRMPELLILDEATSALDSESEGLIQRTVEELHTDVSMLIISHRLSTIAAADNIIVLEGGVVVENGTFDQLVCAGGRFEVLWKLQSMNMTDD